MNPSERVLDPFVVVLCNLPTSVEEGKLICTYSNKDLTGFLKDFAGNLKNTIKVVYNKNGVMAYRGAAYAYAVFKEYYSAYAVSDGKALCRIAIFERAVGYEALKCKERGRSDYERYIRERNHAPCPEMDKIYGWLATEEDFRRLASHGIKDFRNIKRITIGAIMEKKQKQKAQLDEQSDTLRKEIEELDAVLDAQKETLEKAVQDLAGAQADDLAARSAIEEERRQREEELENEKLRCDAEIEAANRQLEEMQRTHGQEKYEQQQFTKQLRRLKLLQDLLRRAKAEKDKFTLQCRLEDTEFKKLAKLAQQEQEQREIAKGKFTKLLQKSMIYADHMKKKRAVEALRAEGIQLEESECQMCMCDFTVIMSLAEQEKAGITPRQFRELNRRESHEAHCWRNIVVPCLHAQTCGGCLYQLELEAKKHKKPLRCLQCRTEIERYMPTRFTG